MDTDAKNKRQNEKAEDELIRHLLLQAEAEEYREVLAKAPPAPRGSTSQSNSAGEAARSIPANGFVVTRPMGIPSIMPLTIMEKRRVHFGCIRSAFSRPNVSVRS